MVINIDSDAAYLVLPKAHSRIAGYFRLLDKTGNGTNAPIIVECKALRNIVSSAAEAETKGVFHNAKIGVNMSNILISMGHPQPPTCIKTDNTTSESFVNKNMQMKRSKSWDIWRHWLRDRSLQKEFVVIWDKAANNLADYFTKPFPDTYHRVIRPQ